MRGILIDPFARIITEIDYTGDFNQIYKLIDCEMFTTVNVTDAGDTLFVDDEGLINGKPQEFFGWYGYSQPLAGKGLLLGSTFDGESADTTLTVDFVRENVAWLSPVSVGGQTLFVCTNADETEH